MKAPDKIYLEKSLSNPDRLHSQWYPNDVIGGGIEYIRKDALMEWLEHAKTVYNIRGAHIFELLTLQMIIEYINEM